jgi:hypothetical protein
LIYFINPCHLITVAQVYLLCSSFSRRSLAVYYASINFAFGPLTAVLLPVLNTRIIRGEQAVYWVQANPLQQKFSASFTFHPPPQHGLILFIVPVYLATFKFPLYRFKHQMSWLDSCVFRRLLLHGCSRAPCQVYFHPRALWPVHDGFSLFSRRGEEPSFTSLFIFVP